MNKLERIKLLKPGQKVHTTYPNKNNKPYWVTVEQVIIGDLCASGVSVKLKEIDKPLDALGWIDLYLITEN